jgi:hypothetical protein
MFEEAETEAARTWLPEGMAFAPAKEAKKAGEKRAA